jgi:hypothetical protein
MANFSDSTMGRMVLIAFSVDYITSDINRVLCVCLRGVKRGPGRPRVGAPPTPRRRREGGPWRPRFGEGSNISSSDLVQELSNVGGAWFCAKGSMVTWLPIKVRGVRCAGHD